MENVKEYNISSLAFLGDAIWELSVREYFFKYNLKIGELNTKTKLYVNAKKQSEIYMDMQNELQTEEEEFSKRARNTKINNFPKTCDVMEYRNATAFEALIGYFYLKGEKHKIESIIQKYILK